MAEEDEGGGGSGVTGMLTRKVGPLPVWTWVMIAGAVGFIIYRMRSAASGTPSASGSNTGQGNQFNSSTSSTSTNPATGDSTTNTYTASGNGYLPGELTYGAGSMPTSPGDIYINYPNQSSNTTGAQLPTSVGTYTVTGKTSPSDQYPLGVVVAAYNLSKTDYTNQAFDSVKLEEENPTLVPPYPVGTVLSIPQITTDEKLGNPVQQAGNTGSAVPVPTAQPAVSNNPSLY
jgi:hypothetical protein